MKKTNSFVNIATASAVALILNSVSLTAHAQNVSWSGPCVKKPEYGYDARTRNLDAVRKVLRNEYGAACHAAPQYIGTQIPMEMFGSGNSASVEMHTVVASEVYYCVNGRPCYRDICCNRLGQVAQQAATTTAVAATTTTTASSDNGFWGNLLQTVATAAVQSAAQYGSQQFSGQAQGSYGYPQPRRDRPPEKIYVFRDAPAAPQQAATPATNNFYLDINNASGSTAVVSGAGNSSANSGSTSNSGATANPAQAGTVYIKQPDGTYVPCPPSTVTSGAGYGTTATSPSNGTGSLAVRDGNGVVGGIKNPTTGQIVTDTSGNPVNVAGQPTIGTSTPDNQLPPNYRSAAQRAIAKANGNKTFSPGSNLNGTLLAVANTTPKSGLNNAVGQIPAVEKQPVAKQEASATKGFGPRNKDRSNNPATTMVQPPATEAKPKFVAKSEVSAPKGFNIPNAPTAERTASFGNRSKQDRTVMTSRVNPAPMVRPEFHPVAPAPAPRLVLPQAAPQNRPQVAVAAPRQVTRTVQPMRRGGKF